MQAIKENITQAYVLMVGVRKVETNIIGDGPENINIKKPLKLRAEDRVL
jgi:hypothetical protein